MGARVADSPRSANRLLVAGDPAVVSVTNPGGSSPFLLIGDHAGRAIPQSLGTLGLDAAAMETHIAWDIGVAGLGARLAQALDATFIAQAYSRLVIDCNRKPGAVQWIAQVSDGVAIPGNLSLGPSEVAARREEIWQPYHDAIAAELDRRAKSGRATALVSLHSFTPAMDGQARPWRMGVLHRGDSALSARMLELLRAQMGERAGDNQPYRMDDTDHTVPLHADARGLDYLELEVRQDLIADEAGLAWAAGVIAGALGRAGEETGTN